jgi:hypothetical protein
VTHSTRPLRLLELAELIHMHRPELGSSTHLKAGKALVRAACGPLMEILPDETISVVHHSFTEYLKGSTRFGSAAESEEYPVLQLGTTHAQLALSCLAYLQSDCLDLWEIKKWPKKDKYDPTPRTNPQMSDLRLKYPFIDYATTNWHIHAHRADLAGFGSTEVYKALDKFLKHRNCVKAWLDITSPDDAIDGITPLHVAARTGLTQYGQLLIDRGDVEVNARDSHGNTALFWATANGHAEIVKLLLLAGSTPDQENNQGLKPLHQAARNNHGKIVSLLLAAGVHPFSGIPLQVSYSWMWNLPTGLA